jgi:outer membrane protein OmpA-like peptidoglycan-associated protein
MNLVSAKRTLFAHTIIAALALGCGSVAAQVGSIPSTQRLAQAEPQKPGEERRKEQQPPKGAQPQTQPQRPGAQSTQPPQGPQRRDQRQDTQQERRAPGAQGQQPGASQQQERQERRPAPGGAPQPAQPRTTQQPAPPPQREQAQPERRQQPAPTQPRTTQQPPPAPAPGAQPAPTQPRTTQQPGQAPGAQPAPTPPRTTQQPPPAPGAQPAPTPPQTTQPRPGQAPVAPAQPQTTQQPPTQPPAAGAPPQRDQRQETLRPPAPGTAPVPPSARPAQPQPTAPGAATADPRVQQQQFEALRHQRQERVENNGQRTVIVEPDHREIIRERDRVIIRHDEVERFRVIGADVRVERRGAETVSVIRRPGNVEIVTYLDDNGRLLRRVRRTPDGREFILIDNRFRDPARAEIFISLPPPRIVIPREQYIVEIHAAPRERIFAALAAPPVERIDRAYALDEIRFSPALRDRMPRVDLDTINFEFGSWQVAPDQIPLLANIAEAINAVTQRNPNEVFLIEGHTDAVGSDVDNLSLSDRRAESVAVILSQNFQVPPENLTTQGYGAQQLKVQTAGPSRENRRVTIRRITPLLTGSSQ